MTIRLCKVCRGWHDPEAWPAGCIPRGESKAAAFPTPMFTSDAMDPMRSMATGRLHTSKRELAAEYRREGVRIVEPGESFAPPKVSDTTTRPTVVRNLKKAGLL